MSLLQDRQQLLAMLALGRNLRSFFQKLAE
jgi:hypothetical protein